MREKGSNGVSGVLLLGVPNKSKSLKQTIVEVLSKEWPLSPKQIFRQIEGKNQVAVIRSEKFAAQVKSEVKGVFAK